MSTFWTGLGWDRWSEEYYFSNFSRTSGSLWRDYFDENSGKIKRVITPGQHRVHSKTSKWARYFCVSMGLAYEFNGQTPCVLDLVNSSMCKWHFREFAPTNCNNYHATICVPTRNSKQ